MLKLLSLCSTLSCVAHVAFILLYIFSGADLEQWCLNYCPRAKCGPPSSYENVVVYHVCMYIFSIFASVEEMFDNDKSEATR